MIRMIMLNNEFPPLGGGTGTVNRALLQRFASMPDLSIDLVTSALGTHPEQAPFADNSTIYKVPVNNRNLHHSSNRELLTYAARALRLAITLHAARQYDFCFAWSAVPAGGVALALHHLTGIPYLVRVCGPDIPGFEQRYAVLYPVLTPVIQAIWRHAVRVVAKCEREAQMIQAVDAQIEPVLVPNGVDLDAFQPASASADRMYGPLRLLCVARLIERKGQHHLIQAVKRLTDAGYAIELELVGTGDAQAQYEGLAQRLGIAQHVHFAGYVPREEIGERYAQAHVFVLPSYNEGMSVATLEAMAAGLALVVTRTGGTDELVLSGINGLTFDWADIETLTAHLQRLATDRILTQQMGHASRERAAQFSWDTAAHWYRQLFVQMSRSPAAEQDEVAV